jgi:hypothetical protein
MVEPEVLAGERSDPDTGLALYHQSLPEKEEEKGPLSRCPNKLGMAILDFASGEWKPARCHRLKCPYCVGVQAFVRSAAIALAAPKRALRFSLVADAGEADPWPVAHYRLNTMRRNYERLTGHGLGEMCSHIEMNPQRTGFHAHVWQHGSRRVDMAALDEASQRAGGGFAKVETVRSVTGAAQYGLKGVGGMSYGMKETEADPTEYLRLNGGRLTHQTRGFFRSVDGSTLSVRAAERAAMAAMFGKREAGAWGMVTEVAARSWASLPLRVGPA